MGACMLSVLVLCEHRIPLHVLGMYCALSENDQCGTRTLWQEAMLSHACYLCLLQHYHGGTL